MLKPETSHVESHGRAALKNHIIQASTLLEIILSGLVLIGLLLTIIPLTSFASFLRYIRCSKTCRTMFRALCL